MEDKEFAVGKSAFNKPSHNKRDEKILGNPMVITNEYIHGVEPVLNRLGTLNDAQAVMIKKAKARGASTKTKVKKIYSKVPKALMDSKELKILIKDCDDELAALFKEIDDIETNQEEKAKAIQNLKTLTTQAKESLYYTRSVSYTHLTLPTSDLV